MRTLAAAVLLSALVAGCGGAGHGSGPGSGMLDPSWSPDARRIVFTRNFQLYVVNADGRRLHRLTRDSALKQDAAWSPTGREIAYLVTEPNETLGEGTYVCDAVYVVRSDGTHERRVSPRTSSDCAPTWSPDGRRLAFTDVGDNLVSQHLVVTSADGRHRRVVASAPNGFEGYAWSPDGTRLAYTDIDPGDLYVYDLRTRRTADLAPAVRRAQPATRSYSFAGTPAWSADGGRIAVDVGVGGEAEDPGLYIVGANGRTSSRVRPRFRTDATSPLLWLPNGSLLAENVHGIYALDPARRTRRLVSADERSLSWLPSPDGRRIVYADDRLRVTALR